MEPCAHPSWCFVFQQWETSSKQADGIQDSHEGRVGKWDRGGSLSLPGLRVSILFQVVLEGCADKKTFEQRPERAQLSGGRTFQMEGVASVKHWGRNSGKRKRQCGSAEEGKKKVMEDEVKKAKSRKSYRSSEDFSCAQCWQLTTANDLI